MARRKRLRHHERGQVLVLFALSLVAIVASVGLVLDAGGAYAQQRNEQRVADLAALAGATTEANCWSGCAVGSLTPRQAIIEAATASAGANGFSPSEMTVNIPPADGKYAGKGGDCSTALSMPCWIEVIVTRNHRNGFASVVGQTTWSVSARAVAVGGVENGVSNGATPIMFNLAAVQASDRGTLKSYCDPQNKKCDPGQNPVPTGDAQFNWTNFCASPSGCNLSSSSAKNIITGGGIPFTVSLGMSLGPNNDGQHTSVCHTLLDTYPNGADLPVAIEKPDPSNPKNAILVGFWMWHFDAANTNCQGEDGELIAGYFVQDLSTTLPLTITPGGGKATIGEFIVRLVE